ncbi:MAG: palindromic element RPE1 domain-containing protein [Holosporaceae bacterium]|nr:palindromic element RPE1 domain-containing protein [Holosporaceae bacterium]
MLCDSVDLSRNRVISRNFQALPERRTAVYFDVREDSSTGTTQKLPKGRWLREDLVTAFSVCFVLELIQQGCS